MHENLDKLKAIFLEAVERQPQDKWGVYLDVACGDDPELRRQVEMLLEVHASGGSLLDKGAIAEKQTIDQPVTEGPGTQIGPYKLLQEIGQGGMGVVYMAEQSEPIRRKVALKIIKPGMDTRQVIARFEAERQALSLMDHPNIARVLDAGTTDSGRPYFVMELVKGEPITEYCDEHHLTPRQRLELLLPVCQAIQHAHQKGIIHRDIKPTNILVAEYDQQPVPKVIDFGVAKAISQPLTEKTMFTGLGQIVGTLEYMSPEQAKVNQLDIDTRSDVYSLGVLMYELLTGSTPFDKQRLRSAAWDEMLRIIREEEPPKPSTRLSDSKDSLPSISAQRQTEPVKLTKLVCGDLDWIVMKALEKDRNRRYETAVGLAHDIQRYLNDEPVVACPPSAVYTFRKLVWRNKAACVTATVVALSLLFGTGVAAWYAARAAQQRNLAIVSERRAETEAKRARSEAAIAKAVNDFLEKDLLGFADATKPFQDGATPDPNITMRTILDRAADNIEGKFPDQPVVEAQVRGAIGVSYISLGEYGKAEDQHRRALVLCERLLGLDHPYTLASRSKVAVVYYLQGRYDEAEKLLQQSLDICQRARGNAHEDTRTVMYGLAAVYLKQGRGQEAEKILDQRLESDRRALGNEHVDVLSTMSDLALTYRQQARFDEAAAMLRQTLQIQQNTLGDEHSDTLTTMFNLAAVCCDRHRYDEAEELARQTLKIHQRTLGDKHPTSLAGMHNLAVICLKEARYDESETLFRQALGLRRNTLGAEHPDTLATNGALAAVCVNQAHRLWKQGKLEESITYFREAIQTNPQLVSAYEGLGAVLATQDKLAAATPHFRKVVELVPSNAMAHYNLGLAVLKQDQLDDAVACFSRAVELDPHAANAHEQLGCALLRKGRKEDAVTAFRQAIKLSPDDATILSDVAWNLATDPGLAVPDAAEAVTYAQKAVDLEPAVANHWSNLGIARVRAGQWQAVVDAFQKADALLGPPGDREHRFFLAMAYWNLADQVHAREAYVQALNWLVENNIHGGEHHHFRDEAEQLMGICKADRSVILLASLTQAVEAEPDNVQALNALARFLVTAEDPQLHDPQKAVELARKAAAANPTSQAFADTLSIAAYRAGDWKTALEARDTCCGARGENSYDALWLAMIHFQLKNETDARQWYDKAVRQIEQEPSLERMKPSIEALRREAEEMLKGTDQSLPHSTEKSALPM